MSSMEKIIEINCLEHIYPDKTKLEICGIELVVNRGKKVAVLGPSGSGKTTMLKHIIGLLTPSHGTVKVFGVDPAKEYKKIRKRIGVILQNVEEQLIGPTVIEDIMYSPLNYGYSQDEALMLAENILKELNITHLKNKIIHYLSGGEKRKVALAGALALQPELLVLDEPFTGLDIKTEKAYINLINEYSSQKDITVIISLHNVELVSEFADTVFLISARDNFSLQGSPREIFSRSSELQKFNLEEPVMVKLFNKLRQKGMDVKIPLSLEEAVEIIQNLRHQPH